LGQKTFDFLEVNVSLRDYSYSVWWNLILITSGSVIYAYGLKAITVPHGFVPGGLFGIGTLIYYLSNLFTPGLWFIVLSVPLVIIGFLFISNRFMFYTFYATIVLTVAFEIIPHDAGIVNQFYAALTSGVICGIGAGIVLKSLGSNGGIDILAIILYQKFNIGLGKCYMFFNLILFGISFFYFEPDIIIASLILVFLTSASLEYVLSAFNQRKVVFIISDFSDYIADQVIKNIGVSSTFINGYGAYMRQPKNVLMTVINNVQLKRLEEIVFTEDANALFIVENTFNVIGSSFSKRKIY